MATKQTIDFSQTKDQSGFNPKRKEEGEYLGVITSFTDTKSKAGAAMWVFGIALKNDRRATYPVYCLLGADQVWKLRNMMMSAGFQVPKKRMTVDGNRLIGKEIGVFLEDDEYEGKPKSVIGSFFPASEYSGPENDDDNDSEDEEYEEAEGDEYEDEESDDTADEEPEDDVPADEDESDEDTEDDAEEDAEDEEEAVEEPEPAPVKAKARPAAKKAPARAKPKPAPVEEDEDEMDVEDL